MNLLSLGEGRRKGQQEGLICSEANKHCIRNWLYFLFLLLFSVLVDNLVTEHIVVDFDLNSAQNISDIIT